MSKYLVIKFNFPNQLIFAVVWGIISYIIIFGIEMSAGFDCSGKCGTYDWISHISLGQKILVFTVGLPGLVVQTILSSVPLSQYNKVNSIIPVSKVILWSIIIFICTVTSYVLLFLILRLSERFDW